MHVSMLESDCVKQFFKRNADTTLGMYLCLCKGCCVLLLLLVSEGGLGGDKDGLGGSLLLLVSHWQ